MTPSSNQQSQHSAKNCWKQ